MIKHYQKIFSLLLAILILALAATPLLAADNTPKEEIIYGKLAADGTVNNIYAVNVFNLPQPTTIVDYGNYNKLTNLSNTSAINEENGRITVAADQGSFYYQGDLSSKDLPWLINIRYYLDNQQITATEAAGKTGHLRLEMTINQNTAVNPIFFENYALQITITIPTEKAQNIQAEQATIAGSGSNKCLSYIIFANKPTTLTMDADVNDFSMEGIQFAGISLALTIDDIDTSDMLSDIHKLQDGIVELNDGAIKLNDGVIELNDGVYELNDGVGELDDKSGELQDGAAELTDGSFDLLDAIGKLADGVAEFSDGINDYADGVAELYQGTRKLHSGADELADGMAELSTGINEYHTSIRQVYWSYRDAGLSEGAAQLLEGSGQFIDGLEQQIIVQQQAAAQYSQAAQAAGQAAAQAQANAAQAQEQAIAEALYPAVGQLQQALAAADIESKNQYIGSALSSLNNLDIDTTEVDQYLQTAAQQTAIMVENTAQAAAATAIVQTLQSVVNNYRNGADGQGGLHSGLQALYLGICGDGTAENPGLVSVLSQLTDGAAELAEGSNQLADGTSELAEGIDQITEGARKLDENGNKLVDGAEELADGTSELQEGAEEYHDGMNDFYDGINKLKDGISELFDGTTELVDGADQLKDGTGELQEGTSKLQDNTDDMDQMVDEQIEKLLEEYGGRDFEQVSFVSADNANIENIQFVMVTEAISTPDIEEPSSPTAEKPDTFWDRIAKIWDNIIDLFS